MDAVPGTYERPKKQAGNETAPAEYYLKSGDTDYKVDETISPPVGGDTSVNLKKRRWKSRANSTSPTPVS